jgi:hypothetical protein
MNLAPVQIVEGRVARMGARTVAAAVRRSIHGGEKYPWPDYLVQRLTKAHYRSRIGDQRDYAQMVARERGHWLNAMEIRSHEF